MQRVKASGLKFICSLVLFLALFRADAADETIRIACVGDSITNGAGIEDKARNNYPAQLQALLGEAYEVRNFGVNGATLLKKGNKPYWEQPAFEAAKAFQPHIVVIKLGTNDSKSRNWTHRAEFKADYLELIATFRQLESRPTVVICYPVPVFKKRFGITNEVVHGEVIPVIGEVAKNTGVPLVDLYAALEGKGALFPDGVHPNAEGAGLIAGTVKAEFERLNP